MRAGRGDSAALASTLSRRLEHFLAPLLGRLDQVLDRRLVKTFTALLSILSPASDVGDAEILRLREEVARWRAGSTRDSIRQVYLLGLLSARAADPLQAGRAAGRLEAQSGALARQDSARASAMARDLALAVRASVARHQGRGTEALLLLERWRPAEWWLAKPTLTKPDPHDFSSLLPGNAYPYERWMRAELLAAHGRVREAIHWYAGLGFMVGEEMSYLVPSHLRMGELHERLGEPARAIECYERVLRLWKEPDPELRPTVEEIRRRVSRLRAASPRVAPS